MKLEYYLKGPNRIVVRKVGELERISSALDFHFKEDSLYFLEYYSARLGIVKINFETKQISGNTWETAEVAQSASYTNYHYTGFLLQGHLSENIKEEILTKVIEDLDDYKIENMVLKLENKPEFLKYIQSRYTLTEHA
ncbi:MAG: hypothetical protein SH817_09240 [Leptospira sp.]|nr:hypothetical protein [Leptospira sp.]